MTTTAEKLKALNEIRVKLGMKVLKAWKESKEKLDLALMTAQRAVTSHETSGPGVLAEVKPAVKADPPKKVNSVKKDDGVSLMTIATDLGMSDKVARAKLRRLGDKVPSTGEHRWVFKGEDVARVKELLGGDRRNK